MKIVHHYVDLDGKTFFDEYYTKISLTDNEDTETYHIVLLLPQNCGVILDLYDYCFDPTKARNTELLVAAVPDKFVDLLNDFEAAKYEIRRICFERPSPEAGGVRRAEKIDVATAQVISKFIDYCPDVIEVLLKNNLLKNKVDPQKLSWEMKDKEAATKLILAISAHPLWKRFSYLKFPAEIFASLLTLIPSPIWFLDPDNPEAPNRFWAYCGFAENNEQKFNILAHALFLNQHPLPLTKQVKLENYFSDLCLRAFTWCEGPLEVRFAFGKWYESLRIATYFWLNFLELHRKDSPFSFDENEFFKNKDLALEWRNHLV